MKIHFFSNQFHEKNIQNISNKFMKNNQKELAHFNKKILNLKKQKKKT